MCYWTKTILHGLFFSPFSFLFSAFASFYCSWGQELLLFLRVKQERKIGHFRATLERETGAILGGKGTLDFGFWVDFWESSEARRVLPDFSFHYTLFVKWDGGATSLMFWKAFTRAFMNCTS
jgi:hypothetical protein